MFYYFLLSILEMAGVNYEGFIISSKLRLIPRCLIQWPKDNTKTQVLSIFILCHPLYGFIFYPQVSPLIAARWRLQAPHPHPIIFKGSKKTGFSLSISSHEWENPSQKPPSRFLLISHWPDYIKYSCLNQSLARRMRSILLSSCILQDNSDQHQHCRLLRRWTLSVSELFWVLKFPSA